MISASHNPDRGQRHQVLRSGRIQTGRCDRGARSSARVARGSRAATDPRGRRHRAQRCHELADRYLRRGSSRPGADLSGLTVVVDAAFGAAYDVGPAALRRLGAEVVALHAEPDGARINVACGTTEHGASGRAASARWRRSAAANVVGVAFDGDADRALFVAEDGSVLSGDHVLLILARERIARDALPGRTVVATVMSNVGLERAMTDAGHRAAAHAGRRPLRPRGDAGRRLRARRRAVRARRRPRSQYDRRRSDDGDRHPLDRWCATGTTLRELAGRACASIPRSC